MESARDDPLFPGGPTPTHPITLYKDMTLTHAGRVKQSSLEPRPYLPSPLGRPLATLGHFHHILIPLALAFWKPGWPTSSLLGPTDF